MAPAQRETRARSNGLRRYLRESRDPLNSVVLVLPLFVAYQIGVLGTGGLRNGVDFMTDLLLAGVAVAMGLIFGRVTEAGVTLGYILVNLCVLAGFVVAVWILRGRGRFQPRLWPGLLLESLVYAIFFGSAVRLMMQAVGADELALLQSSVGPWLAAGGEPRSPFVSLIQSIGAGLYEEIVFRAGLLGGTYALLKRWGRIGTVPSWAVAVVVSSAIFSGVHHLGALGDPFTVGVFLFRFFAGVLLATIYAVRGFAVAVYTHAIYDVIVMIFLGRP